MSGVRAHNAELTKLGLTLPLPFKGAEPEGLILDDRAARGHAILVADELRRLRRKVLPLASPQSSEVVAVRFENTAVELIRPALGYQ